MRKFVRGIVFNVMRFSVNDGPGIRTTVFLKGCPLKCLWCHNPESINPGYEILVNKDRCIRCGNCFLKCTNDAIFKEENDYYPLPENCLHCGKCVESCYTDARSIVGKEYTANELIKEILKDKVFYDQSGGGATFSGGEPFLQSEFLLSALKLCKENNIHTAIDTSGYTSRLNIEKASELTDLFLYDIKILDDEMHKKFTGVSNKLILENLKLLVRLGKNIVIRIPVIPGFNNSAETIEEIGKFVSSMKINTINILPYHKTGIEKYSRLGREYLMNFNSAETIDPTMYKDRLQKYIPEIIVGG